MEDLNFTPEFKQSQEQPVRKRKSSGIDLNKKPQQRLKVRKHRPRIFDVSKPKNISRVKEVKKKVPKSEIAPGLDPKTLDATTPKKLPKEKKVRKNVCKSENTSELELDPKTPSPCTPEPLAPIPILCKGTPLEGVKLDVRIFYATKPKKIPKKKKVRNNVSKSENTLELELGPKTPSSCTPEPLAPIPGICKEVPFEGTKYENKIRQTIGRFSGHGTNSCRRTLNFNLENPVGNGSDGNVTQVVTGSVDELTDGSVDVEQEQKEQDSTLINSRLDEGSVSKSTYTYYQRQWRKSGEISVFDMLIPRLGLGYEDFGSSFGMRKIIQEYQRKNFPRKWVAEPLVALLKDFPKVLKKGRTRREKRNFNSNLRKTIKMYNGQKVPTKRRSNTKRGSVCWGRVLPTLGVNRSKISKRRQNLTYKVNQVSSTSLLNLPEWNSTSLLNIPEAASTSLLTLSVADGYVVSSQGNQNHLMDENEIVSFNNQIQQHHFLNVVCAENQSSMTNETELSHAVVMSSHDKIQQQHHLNLVCEEKHNSLMNEKKFFHTCAMYSGEQIQHHCLNSFTSEAELYHSQVMCSNHQVQQQYLGSDDGMLRLQLRPRNYQDNNLLMMQEVHNDVTINVEKLVPKSEDLCNGIDILVQKLESLHIRDNFKQDPCQNTCGELVPHTVKIKPSKIHKPVPKVDLDEETLQIWNRLMANAADEATKEHDEEKEKWWEKEREIFRKRVDSLIARMHLIQGNRKFSPWKGSVVDSVVGVFLTQNVSDNLSSSAFMSLASRFPLAPRAHQSDENDCHEDIGLSQESVVDEDIALSQDSVGSNGIMNSCSQESIGKSDVTERLTSDANRKQLSKFQIELDTSQQLKEDKVNLSITTSENIVLSSVEDERTVEEKSAAEEISNCGCSTSEGYFDCSFKEKSASTRSFNSNNNHQGGKEKTKTVESINEANVTLESATNSRKKKAKVKEKKEIDWDELRRVYSSNRPRPVDKMDSIDWNAVRRATVREIADIIAVRGMNNILGGRIKDFLDRVVEDHKTIDLEWLRSSPADLVKDYLSSIDGLGLKSVECVRLLALQHHAFPVDTNVGRIAVRLGWVPLQPLPGNLEIDLLTQYPLVDSIQKYLWPRLCMLDQQKLYELHYQLITFGKVFCTKRQPNCNACPLKAECRHFASAYARAKLRLPAQEEKSMVNANNPCTIGEDPRHQAMFPLVSLANSFSSKSDYRTKSCDPTVEFPQFPEHECTEPLESNLVSESCDPIVEFPRSPEQECKEPLESNQGSESSDPIVGVPSSKELESVERLDRDIEDLYKYSDDEIPTIRLDTEELRATMLQLYDKAECDISKALICITPEASIPTPKLKIVSRLRTVHNVYLLEDGHSLLQTFDKREIDDPCPYLLAIWVSGDSTNAVRDKNNDEVSGTILIPCRTAMRGSFPLNGTYFQVNEVFADDESSECPIRVPRKELHHLKRRALYCGTSATSIFKGMDTPGIQYCFWKGFVCVRSFNRKTRAPKPLPKRFRPPGGPAKNFKEEYEYDE